MDLLCQFLPKMQRSLESQKDLRKSYWPQSQRKGLQSLYWDGGAPLPTWQSENDLWKILRKVCKFAWTLDQLCQLWTHPWRNRKMPTNIEDSSATASGRSPWSRRIHSCCSGWVRSWIRWMIDAIDANQHCLVALGLFLILLSCSII